MQKTYFKAQEWYIENYNIREWSIFNEKQKANLQRRLKEESERHQKEKRQQQLRILRLKRQEERKQYELQKLSELHAKQNTVVKRQTEEVNAANKRMRMMHTSSTLEKS